MHTFELLLTSAMWKGIVMITDGIKSPLKAGEKRKDSDMFRWKPLKLFGSSLFRLGLMDFQSMLGVILAVNSKNNGYLSKSVIGRHQFTLNNLLKILLRALSLELIFERSRESLSFLGTLSTIIFSSLEMRPMLLRQTLHKELDWRLNQHGILFQW